MKSEQFYIFLVFKQSNQSILDFEIFKQTFRMQFKFLEKTPLRIFGFLPMYTHWILHFGGLRTLNHEPNKQCDRLLIRDSPMIVRWPPYGSYSFFHNKCEMTSWPEIQFFHNPKIWRHPWFVIWEFLEGIYMNLCKFTLVAINAPDVRIIFKDFVWVNACPPTAGGGRSTQNKNVCVDALHHKTTCP